MNLLERPTPFRRRSQTREISEEKECPGYNPRRMFRVFGILFLALGLIVLGAAVLAVVRGRIWRDPLKLKSHRRRRPGRWLHRAADPREFWLDVAWHTLIAAAAVAMAVSCLGK